MAFTVKDRVKETCSAPGTGTVTLLGAALGFVSFATIGNDNSTYYCIATQGGNDWEVGIGTYTSSGTTLSRDTVISNSLGTTAKINFSSGTQDVFCTYPSEAVDPIVSATAPTVPLVNGIMWYDSTNGVLLSYYDGAWVEDYHSLPGMQNYDFENCGSASTTSFTYALNCGTSAP